MCNVLILSLRGRIAVSLRIGFRVGAIVVGLSVLSFAACKSLRKDSQVQNAEYAGKYNWASPKDGSRFCKLKNEYDSKTDAEVDAIPGLADKMMSQCVGQETWYKATGGGSRFHTYVSQQRMAIYMDFDKVLNSKERYSRFKHWGVINDPGCCTPGTDCDSRRPNDPIRPIIPGSQGKTLADTFGWDFCVGDDVLLSYVGKKDMDYTAKDPACELSKVEAQRGDRSADEKAKVENPCFLEFGTSSGTMQLRKFPNPRFDSQQWAAIGGWPGYSTRLDDGSIEPPFMIGQSCGTCHISFDPTNPPADPERPHYDNVLGAVGSQFTQITEIFTNGLISDSQLINKRPKANVLFQMAGHVRAGVVDTSAVTQDMVNNPGTPNAIINLGKRPGLEDRQEDSAFKEHIYKWEKSPAENGCPAEDKRVGTCDANGSCFSNTCVAVKSGTWHYNYKQDFSIPHVLKGGEDSIGPEGSVQRVYLNIFSCTETCITNSLSDLFVFGKGRNSIQTPVDLGQCRKDCPAFRAVEDRVYDIYAFLANVRPTNLGTTQTTTKDPIPGAEPWAKVIADIKGNTAKYKMGQDAFLEKCASCHSNRPELAGTPEMRQHIFAENGIDLRIGKDGVVAEWFGSDIRIPQPTVGTYKCRALHSNHAKGHLWDFYASEESRNQPAPDDLDELKGLHDGRGYYRAPSLLNLWAFAPFLHNNALGPDVEKSDEFKLNDGVAQHSVPNKLGADGKPVTYAVLPKDPSFAGRVRMYKASMHELLYPDDRTGTRTADGREFKGKVLLTDTTLDFSPIPDITAIMNFLASTSAAIGIDVQKLANVASFRIGIPKGTSMSVLGSIRHKALVDALLGKMVEIKNQFAGRSKLERIKAQSAVMVKFLSVFNAKGKPSDLEKWLTDNGLTNCGNTRDGVPPLENQGHLQGSDLSVLQKEALIDFLMTI
jgi:hypothetical protein